MSRFAQRHKTEILIIAVLFAIFICSMAMAKQQMYAPVQGQGTTADFARAYPFVVLAFASMLIVIIWYFIKERDKTKRAAKEKRDADMRKNLNDISESFKEANRKLEKNTEKIDATINTLFDRDRENERDIADLRSAVSGLMKTCEARARMCPGASGIYCYDRRLKDGGRREGNGYRRERKTDGDDTLQVDG